MNLPAGFISPRSDILIDVVILSFVIILPILIWSWSQVRQRHYQHHRNTQLSLGIVLAIAVVLFEIDLRLSGGIFELTKDSVAAGTFLLNFWIWSHMAVSILTSLIWIVLIPLSLSRFGNPAKPNAFSRTHKLWGRTGMITMMLTGLSAIPLYYYGFML
jgi:putative membrane protein